MGAGHLMRCLTIADAIAELAGSGNGVLFVCADGESARLAEEQGFAAKALHTDYRHMEQELPLWDELMAQITAKCVILIDSYFVTDIYLEKIRTYGYTVLLDDMQARPYPVDAVINYNAFADENRYKMLYQGTDTAFYLGSRYVPVRKQFLGRSCQVAGKVENVLLTTGGGDVDNIAGRILEALDAGEGGDRKEGNGKEADSHFHEITYHVIIGKFNPHLDALKQLAAERPWIHLHCDVQDMAGLMEKCDLAITAGGTTIYELAAVGVPFICFSYAENQEQLTQYVGEKGIAGFAGAYHKAPGETLGEMARLFKEFCGDREKREQCCLMERDMIDGRGAGRLAEEIYI